MMSLLNLKLGSVPHTKLFVFGFGTLVIYFINYFNGGVWSFLELD